MSVVQRRYARLHSAVLARRAEGYKSMVDSIRQKRGVTGTGVGGGGSGGGDLLRAAVNQQARMSASALPVLGLEEGERGRGRSASADQGVVRGPTAWPGVGLEGGVRVGGVGGRLPPIVGKVWKEEEKEAEGVGGAGAPERSYVASGRAMLTPLQRNVREKLARLDVIATPFAAS